MARKGGDNQARARADASRATRHSFADEIRLFPGLPGRRACLHAVAPPLRLGVPCPAVRTALSSRAAAPDPGHTQHAVAASPAPERAGGLDLLGLLPASLLSFSLPSSGKQQQGWRLDNPHDKQDAAQAHDWTAAALCSVDSRGNGDISARSAPGSVEFHRGLQAEEGPGPTSSNDHDAFDEQFAEPEFRVVKFDHSKPEAVGVGVYFEKMSTPESRCGVRVARLQPGGSADVEGSIAVGDLLLSVDDINVAGIASMNDLARLVLGDEGTAVKLRMQRSRSSLAEEHQQFMGDEGTAVKLRMQRSRSSWAEEHQQFMGDAGTAVKLRTQRSSKERSSKESAEACRTYEIHLVRSRPPTTQAPPLRGGKAGGGNGLSPAGGGKAGGNHPEAHNLLNLSPPQQRQVYAQLRP